MEGVFQLTYSVRPQEAGYLKRIRPDSLLHYLQAAAYEHSTREGFSAFHLFGKGLTWVLSRYHLRILRYPAVGEEVCIRTWYPGSQRPFYLRDWEIVDPRGETLLLATSSWLILDLATRKPVEDDRLLGGLVPRAVRALDDDFPTLPAPENPRYENRFCVRLGDTDLNRHVNHVYYVQWALESAPPEVLASRVPLEIEAGYRGEARHGDVVVVHTGASGDGTFLHQLLRESDGKELTRVRTKWGKEAAARGEGPA